MGSSKGWSVFALLIGIIGLGLSGYTYFIALPQASQQQSSGIQNFWYDTYTGSSITISTSYTPVPGISVIVTVNQGESLHVLFNTDVYYEANAGIELLEVYLKLNDYRVISPHATFGTWFSVKMWTEMTLAYTNVSISPGVYNISVVARAPSSTATKSLYDMTLYAHTIL